MLEPRQMSQVFAFGEFDESKEDWLSYTERLQQYLLANDVPDEKQHAVLLSGCGPTTYQLIRNLTVPAKPTAKSFADLVALVKEHKNPRPSVIVRQYAFHTRQQNAGENVAEFVADLRRLSDYYNFGETLQEMLPDRLVCGIYSNTWQNTKQMLNKLKFARILDPWILDLTSCCHVHVCSCHVLMLTRQTNMHVLSTLSRTL